MNKTDILIIGTGMAGLLFAIKTARRQKNVQITIMTKDKADTTNTRFAQGGIAVVIDRLTDSFQQHVADTLASGDGACNEKIVKMVVEQAPSRLQELISLGVSFDREGGALDLGLEGGHSQRRIVHHSDSTGLEIENSLLSEARRLENITILEHHFALDLMLEDSSGTKQCVGAFYFDNKDAIRYIRAKITVLSTGGCGQLFSHTTNAPIATGDGVAMARRAGAKIEDMQYIQFHPTAFFEPGRNPYFLLSEALRGAGAHIVDHFGKRFVFKHDLRGELATRDVVSKAIFEQLSESGQKHVYLDCRHIDDQVMDNHFAAIKAYLKSHGIDPSVQLIPIVPVAHYQCGGVCVDKFGQTSIDRLFAIGECSRTGLHGKNRLASNSLLEAAVFAHQASEAIAGKVGSIQHSTRVYVNKSNGAQPIGDEIRIGKIRSNLRKVMEGFYVGQAHELALVEIKMMRETAEAIYVSGRITRQIIEVINMLSVAQIIVTEAKNNNLKTQNQLQ